MKKIEFYFDYLSPYSYLAYQKVKKNFNDPHLEWEILPVSLPLIIGHYKTLGPGQIEPKRNYLMRELMRQKTLQKIPFVVPKALPFNSLYALRLTLASFGLEHQKKMLELFFNASWGLGLDLSSDDLIKNILCTAGLPGEELIEQSSAKENKRLLRDNIERAINHGVFGVPSFVVSSKNMAPELFWGHDSLHHLMMFLQNEDPLPREEYENFIKNYPMSI